MAQLGFIGERIDLLIRAGATFGLYHVELVSPLGVPFNLAGCTVIGKMKKRLNSPDVTEVFDVIYEDRSAGKFSFGMSDEKTAEIPGGADAKDNAGNYFWSMDIENSSGEITPLYYGSVKVIKGL